MTLAVPSSLNRSSRGPTMAAAVSPAMPPIPWTIIPPAKSVNPNELRNPPAHVSPVTTG